MLYNTQRMAPDHCQRITHSGETAAEAEIEQVSSVWTALSSVLCTINHPPELVLIMSSQRREWTEHSYQAPSVVLKTWPPHGDELGTNLILTDCFGHTHSVLVRKTDQD